MAVKHFWRGGFALAAALAVAIIATALWLGPDTYRRWKHDRFLARAKAALEAEDVRTATLQLRKALLSQPDNVESARLMARLAEENQSPQIVGWRERIAELEPGVSSNYLAWAGAALQFGDLASAEKALNLAADGSATNANYHLASAKMAAAQRNEAQTLAHLEAAASLAPEDDTLPFKLAVIRLGSTNATLRLEGRRELEGFLQHEQLQLPALRQLTTLALAANDRPEALRWSEQLTRQTNAAFGDQLLRLQALHVAQSADEASHLALIFEAARGTTDAAIELGRWFIASRQPTKALDWMNSLSPAIRTNLPGALVAVDALAGTERWTEIPSFLNDQNWGGFESMRHALTAHAWWKLNQAQAFKGAWSRALRGATTSREGLIRLAQMAAAWKWTTETEAVLWEIVTRHPAEKWAFKNLTALLYVGGKTRPLKTLLEKLAAAEPDNLAVRNNLAMTGLLLNPDDPTAHRLARECYEGDPTNPNFVSTHAFALSLAGKPDEALQVFGELGDEHRGDTIGVYLGLVLSKAGRNAEAAERLRDWEKVRLLPEEVALVRRALATLTTKDA